MIQTCWLLSDMPEYADHGLRRWSHMLGFRGHFLTKSRAYSTTFATIRGARAQHRADETRDRLDIDATTPTITEREWAYAGRDSASSDWITPRPRPST